MFFIAKAIHFIYIKTGTKFKEKKRKTKNNNFVLKKWVQNYTSWYAFDYMLLTYDTFDTNHNKTFFTFLTGEKCWKMYIVRF